MFMWQAVLLLYKAVKKQENNSPEVEAALVEVEKVLSHHNIKF